MKYFLTICAVSLFFFAGSVQAAPLEVQFETVPLFGESNFLPGDTITKTVTVTNNSGEDKSVYTELINVVDDDGLGDAMGVIINNGDFFTGSFVDFDTAGKVGLSTLSNGASTVYTYRMTFFPESGNEYQYASLSFDLCIGFAGGNFECDDGETSGGDGDGDGDGDGGGSTGGGGSRSSGDGDGDGDGDTGTPEDFGTGGGFPFAVPLVPSGSVAGAEGAGEPQVLGEATGTGSTTLPDGIVAGVSDIISVDCACVMPILLIVLGIFYGWVLIRDLRLRNEVYGSRRAFSRNSIFAALMVVVLVLLNKLLLLCDWWLLALLFMIGWFFFDFRERYHDMRPWNPSAYHYWHMGWYAVVAVLSYFFWYDCLFLPMLIATILSVIWFFISHLLFMPSRDDEEIEEDVELR